MRLNAPLFFILTALLIGCDEKPAPAPVKAPEPPKPKNITVGKVELLDMPDSVESVVEVICVGYVPNNVYEMITRQQKAFDALQHPKQTSATAASTTLMSEEDQQKLTARITALQRDFPDPVVSNIYGDDGETIQYTSRKSLFERYAPMVQAITVNNLETSLNKVIAQMRTDHELLVKLTETPGEGARQAKADISWLAAFSEYFQRFQGVVTEYDQARHKQVTKDYQAAVALQNQASPKEEWERVQAEVSPNIEIELYKTAKDSGYAEPDGSFRVPGHGKMIVRVIMEGYSVFFINDGPGGDHINITDVQEIVVEPGL